VIIVAVVSCIYGLGSPEAYDGMLLRSKRASGRPRRHPAPSSSRSSTSATNTTSTAAPSACAATSSRSSRRTKTSVAIRIELFGDEVDAITCSTRCAARSSSDLDKIAIYPASHYVTPKEKLERAVRVDPGRARAPRRAARGKNKLLEAQRLEQRTRFDLEMMRATRPLQGHRELQPPPRRAGSRASRRRR
jgi:excinuclease ABC subunit B